MTPFCQYLCRTGLPGCLLCLLLLGTHPARAQMEDSSDFVTSIGLSKGGNSLLSAGDGQKLEGWMGYRFQFGRVFPTPLDNLFTQVDIGLKEDYLDSGGNEMRFSRFPLEVIPFYQTRHARIGLGITYHLNPTYEEGPRGARRRSRFDNALGWVLQADATVSKSLSIGFRMEQVGYDGNNALGDLDGTSIGLHLNFHY